MVGLSVFFQSESIPLIVFAQVPGKSLRIDAAEFQKMVREMRGDLEQVFLRYTQAMFNQLAQQVACNAVDPLEQRCARWLLMTHDRVGSDQFPLTQEFLAQMLAVRRSSVTVIAGALQKAGLITYSRGMMTILDRAGLEAAACEHYQLIKNEYDRQVP